MRVISADGVDVGAVDDVGADHVLITRQGSVDGHHHRVGNADIDRVDEHVHLALSAAAIAALPAASHAAAPGAAVVSPARPRSPLLWILGLLALLALALLAARSCSHDKPAATTTTTTSVTNTATTPALAVETVTLPGGDKVDLAPDSMNYGLQRYLASGEPAPRTFTFDQLNFDTARSEIRAADRPSVDALAQILRAYPKAKGRVVGYADAKGEAGANRRLGEDRARSVVAALAEKGVSADRISAATGGESNPVATNATAPGRFENRRTEFEVTAK